MKIFRNIKRNIPIAETMTGDVIEWDGQYYLVTNGIDGGRIVCAGLASGVCIYLTKDTEVKVINAELHVILEEHK